MPQTPFAFDIAAHGDAVVRTSNRNRDRLIVGSL